MRAWLKLAEEFLAPMEVEPGAGECPLDQVEEGRPEPLIEEEEKQKSA